jgi:hypothetical protein
VKGHGVVPYVSRFERSLSARWKSSPQRTCHSVSQATAAASQRQRPLGLEIIASARRALLRGSDAYPQKRSAYCGGVSGVGGERAGAAAELGG